MKYKVIDECGSEETIEAVSVSEAKEKAEEWVRDGSWDTEQGTAWVSAVLYDEDDERIGSIKVAINPAEPECTSDEGHDWQAPIEIVGGIKENPGVWYHGGGVRITEVCVHCGCECVTDTWAQDMSDGEQGLESVTYTPGKYRDEIEEMREENTED